MGQGLDDQIIIRIDGLGLKYWERRYFFRGKRRREEGGGRRRERGKNFNEIAREMIMQCA